MGLEIEVIEVKSEYAGNYVVVHEAKVKVWVRFDSKVIKDIANDVWEFLPEFVDIDAKEYERYKDVGLDPATMKIENYVKRLEDEFKQEFEKELIRELKVDYEIKSIKKEEEGYEDVYEIEVVFKEEFDSEMCEEREIIDEIEELKENFKGELVAIIEGAFGSAKYNLAEKVARKILIESLREEDDKQDKETKEELSEEPIEEFRRAIIVGSKDFYITLPKSYLKYLYRKFRKVPKWVKFAYYKDGKIVIEPIWSEKEIEKEKLEWFGITKL